MGSKSKQGQNRSRRRGAARRDAERKHRPARAVQKDASGPGRDNARKSFSRRPSPGANAERSPRRGPERLWIYGRHAALAAIANPNRKINRIVASASALAWLHDMPLRPDRLKSLSEVEPDALDRLLHEGAVHQGLAVEVAALPRPRLKEVCQPDGARRPVIVLDQITDPHNIGAIFRSAAAFGAHAIVVQDRRTPPLAGALAKAAAGAVETVPCAPVVNIARALEDLKGLGYFCAGLAGEASAAIADMPADRPVALVLGAEGAGLRPLVRAACDSVYAIPIAHGVDSLNVSNAAAISLYEIARRRHAND